MTVSHFIAHFSILITMISPRKDIRNVSMDVHEYLSYLTHVFFVDASTVATGQYFLSSPLHCSNHHS